MAVCSSDEETEIEVSSMLFLRIVFNFMIDSDRYTSLRLTKNLPPDICPYCEKEKQEFYCNDVFLMGNKRELQGCRGKGFFIPIPIPFPQDFCGNSHRIPTGFPQDSHMWEFP